MGCSGEEGKFKPLWQNDVFAIHVLPFGGDVRQDDVGGALGSTSGSAAIMANRISFCMGQGS